jgi:integrase
VRAWKKGGRIGPPKSKASRRTIALPDQVTDVIRPLLERPGSAWLFTTETGKPVTHNNFWNRIWHPATVRASICDEHLDPDCHCIRAKHAGCPVHTGRNEKGWHIIAEPCGCPGTLSPRPRIHDARHTHASWLIANGVRLEVIQDRLGHEDYATTRKVYSHLMPDMRREAGQAAQVAFNSTRLAISPPDVP